jgi:hypothetical protein
MTRAVRRAALTSLTGLLLAGVTAVGIGRADAQTSGHRPRPGQVSGHAAAVTAGQQDGVRRYWTPTRMERAVPLRPPLSRDRAAGHPRPAWLRAPLIVSPRAPLRRPRRPTRAPLAGPPREELRAALTVSPTAALRAPLRSQQAAAANGALWSGGGAVARTTGKVFFTLGRHDYVCSASTVASGNSAVVVTAGHCVKDGTGAWAANWTFVPGYTGGKDLYGSYTARRFYVASQWSTQADNDYDVAFVTVNPAVVKGAKVAVVREVGGQGIEFGRQPAREAVFGYPADPPYNGQQLAYCSGRVSPDPYGATTDTGLRCAMTAGSSGGPWLSGFSGAAGTGIISSVSSFKYSTSDTLLYGPELGPVAQAMYRAAARG